MDGLITDFTQYEDSSLVEFINQDSVILIDTVKTLYKSPSGKYGCLGAKEPSLDCSGYYILSIGDFLTGIYQEPNQGNNAVYQIAKKGNKVFDLTDTIENYTTFLGKNLHVKKYERYDTIIKNKECIYFFMSFNNKLIEYGIKNKYKIDKWFLNE